MEDFESTPEFQALVVAAAGKPERSMGDSVIPAEPPQWKSVLSQARTLAEQAPLQLAVHVYLIQAEANVNGFRGFQQSLQALLTLLQNQWDELYPEPDRDDPDDMYYARVNLVNELAEQPLFLDAIHRMPLVSARGIGEFSARDMDIAAGTLSASEEDQARCQEGLIRGAFAESDPAELQLTADALEALPILCRGLEALFAEHCGPHDGVSMERLMRCVEGCQVHHAAFAADFLTSPADEPDQSQQVSDTDTGESESSAQASSSSAAVSSRLGSRAAVLETFNAILLYYQRHEPSSPVRVLTLCARDMVDKPFFEILQALAPMHRESLPALLSEIQKQPLAALLSDSFNRFLGGESLPLVDESEIAGSGSDAATGSDSGDAGGDAVGQGDAVQTATAQPPSGNSHTVAVIDSREQVLVSLQDIENWFLNAEPASPIPLIIADIRRLVPRRFSELVAEFSRLLPESVADEQ